MYCLRKLNYFHVDKRILALFYESVVASVWRYCLLCWGGNVSQGGRDKITRIVNQAGRMIGEPRQNLEDVYADLLITKLTNVMDDASHPLHDRLAGQLIYRSGRMRLPWLADIFPPLFHRQSEFTMQTFREAQFPLICNLFFYSFLVCIFVSFHYVHNFEKWSNKVLLDLTWHLDPIPCSNTCIVFYCNLIHVSNFFDKIFYACSWERNKLWYNKWVIIETLKVTMLIIMFIFRVSKKIKQSNYIHINISHINNYIEFFCLRLLIVFQSLLMCNLCILKIHRHGWSKIYLFSQFSYLYQLFPDHTSILV